MPAFPQCLLMISKVLLRKSIEEIWTKMNDELNKIQSWLNSNKLSLSMLKTPYMVFTPRNKCTNDADVKINDASFQRVYVSKFLGVLVDSKLNWKNYIDHICKKLAKWNSAECKKKMLRSFLISLYYSFAYPYLIYCNHVWGNIYKTNTDPIVLMQKNDLDNYLLTIPGTHWPIFLCQ